MNKNATTHENFEERLAKACPKRLIERLARDHGFCQRSWLKLSPTLFVHGLCRGTLNALPSLNVIAGTIAAISGATYSKQALSKRIKQPAVTFLQHLLRSLIAYPLKIDISHLDQLLTVFPHIWLVDSTCIKLHPSLKKFFPGGRNQTQKPSAVLKIQLGFDLYSGLLHAFGLSPYTRNDQKASHDILSIAKKGDLIIRDLGYYSLKVFAQMNDIGIYFISRIRYGVSIAHMKSEGEKIWPPSSPRLSL